MATQKKPKRQFNGMGYGDLQRANSANRGKLTQEEQKWLKANGYRNVGWENAIALCHKIEELLDTPYRNMDLEELFLEADRIGNKYQTSEEIRTFNQHLSQEVAEIADLVDQQFPDDEVEVIDFSRKTAKRTQKHRNQKTYRTAKL
ncbi:MAG TPA: hypothetical protein V6C84_28305 [Coleofasciculaceae cyanobacterium]|jgi:hypothetical protein